MKSAPDPDCFNPSLCRRACLLPLASVSAIDSCHRSVYYRNVICRIIRWGERADILLLGDDEIKRSFVRVCGRDSLDQF